MGQEEALRSQCPSVWDQFIPLSSLSQRYHQKSNPLCVSSFPETAPAPPAPSWHNSAVSLQLQEFQQWPKREEKCFLLQDAPRSQVKDTLMICAPTKVYSHPWQHSGVQECGCCDMDGLWLGSPRELSQHGGDYTLQPARHAAIRAGVGETGHGINANVGMKLLLLVSSILQE